MKGAVAGVALACLAAWPVAHAEEPVVSEGPGFDQKDGGALYRAICQGCHMADGRGAQGAGSYPKLAANARLGSARYVVVTVLNGRRAMPGFKDDLSDEQVAEVANYVRTNLGNDYPRRVLPADVKASR